VASTYSQHVDLSSDRISGERSRDQRRQTGSVLRADRDAQARRYHVLEMSLLAAAMDNFGLGRIKKVIRPKLSPDGTPDALDPHGVCEVAQRNHIVLTKVCAGGGKYNEALFEETPAVDSLRQCVEGA
jgi:hypothetical protein